MSLELIFILMDFKVAIGNSVLVVFLVNFITIIKG